MERYEVRMRAMGLFDHLPPDKKHQLAVLDEARRLVTVYVYSDDERLPLEDGKSSFSSSAN